MRHTFRALPLLLACHVGIGAAQAPWLPATAGNMFDLRISKGFYGDDGPGLATFTVTPSLRVAISPRVMLEAEVPVAAASEDNPFTDESVSGLRIGNPYAGVAAEIAPTVTLRAGVRVSLIPDDINAGGATALGYGVISEFDRYEAYIPDYTTFRATAEMGKVPAKGGFAQVRIGGTMFMAGSGGDNESLVEYGARVGLHTGTILLHGGLLGRGFLTSDGDASLADRTTHMLMVGVGGTSGRVRPKAEFRMFLDEFLRDAVTGVLAVGAEFAL